MLPLTAVLLSGILVSFVTATEHTLCYNYFMTKDGCVNSNAETRLNCKAPAKTLTKVSRINSGPKKLVRRYDTVSPLPPMKGKNACPHSYDPKNEDGVCLWSGTSPAKKDAGWVNAAKQSNCGNRVYFQRQGDPKSVFFAKVLDACDFEPSVKESACFQIGLTPKLFARFAKTEEEKKTGVLTGVFSWDFDNEQGNSPSQAPV